MCGIAGFIDLKGQTGSDALRRTATAMAETLVHRGPDSNGVWEDAEAGVALAFRRLAIIDLTPAGNQPMQSANERFVAVYNGEIYNFRELREDLLAAGVTFRGDSDTEVLLEGIVAWGLEKTLSRAIGMFAFALWDRDRRELTLCRDRLGIKPLFYGLQDGVFLFASELKALRAHDGWRPQLDRQALTGYARFNYVPAPLSIYAGIRKLQPGHLLRYRPGGEPALQSYWDMTTVAAQHRRQITDADAIAEAETLLSDAVKRRMIADVPLGALLSGGIDSSTVVALMQQHSSRPVKTFTIGFSEAGFDESAHARAVANHLGTDHTEVTLSVDAARELIPRLADWHDEPFADSSALPTRLVCEIAHRDVTVALSGDGGDEAFLGYNRYHAAQMAWHRTRCLPAPLRRVTAAMLRAVPTGLWDGLSHLVPASRRPGLAGDKLHKLADLLCEADPDAVYKRLVSHWPEPDRLVCGGEETFGPDWENASAIADFGERMAFLDTNTYLPGDILTKLDRASMSTSLETRVPLIDHRVLEFAWSLPKRMRLRDGRGKWLLRRVLLRHVPDSIIDRPKAGFAVPIAEWLRGPLRDWAEDLLAERGLRDGGWFEPVPIRAAWAEHLSGRGNHWQALWGICMAQAWRQRWEKGLQS